MRSHSASSPIRPRHEEPLVALPERAREPLVLGSSSSGSARSSAVNRGRRDALRRNNTSASFETPTNGDASTLAARRRRSGCAGAAGTRAGRRPAAGRSSRARCAKVGRPSRRSASSYRSASVPAANSTTISPGSASPESTSSRTRLAIRPPRPRASAPACRRSSPCRSRAARPGARTRDRQTRRRGERLVVVAERVAEEVVHRVEHLRSRAIVPRSARDLSLLPVAAEDLESACRNR